MISSSLKQAIENTLCKTLNHQCSILNSQPVGGGCINESFQIKTTAGNFFIKWNDKKRYPRMFEAEAKGLNLLKQTNAIPIPNVIAQGEFEDSSYLILEWIESNRRIKNFWEDFGNNFAKLHHHSNEHFGLDHNNYIGSLKQSNRKHLSWNEFFIDERLKPQIKLAHDSGRIDSSAEKLFDQLFLRFDDLIPEEKPSLLHGDLWNGNFLVNQGGSATIIDPAVYYGHREMDLAMTHLFGGFDDAFYEAYQQTSPLLPGFNERIDIHNLYPLMVHVNLFGGSYSGQVKSILNRFI